MKRFMILTYLLGLVFAESEVDYYTKLVDDESAKALVYNLPNNAKEYTARPGDVKASGEYDFIIIGAGVGGTVMANRLSEIEDWSVLLLEAGGWESNFTDIPGMYFFVEGTKYNWNFKSTPQTTSCLGMKDHVCLYARGKGFGGTSLINGLVYSRGNRLDYDKWENEGNSGWSYENVLKYFVKSENTTIDNADPGYHGRGGYLHVEYHKPFSGQFYKYISANEELGRKQVDYNGRQQLGVTRAQSLMINGRRESSSKAFLNPILPRKNLKLSGYSYVTKIIIDKRRKAAVGVEFTKNGKTYRVKAKKEVILAAGAIQSPQIMMLSGIGPKEHLKDKNIELIADLPVGNNLIDHPTYYGLNILSDYIEPIKSTREYVKEYLQGSGPYAVAGNNQGLGFFQTLETTPGLPDLEMMMIPSNRTNPYFQKSFGYTDETYQALIKNIQNNSTFTLYLACLHPKGLGSIKLKSNDPFEYPLIDSRLLSDPNNHDIEVLYRGVLLVKQMLGTKAYKSINARMDLVNLPQCRHLKIDTKPYWYCLIRHMSMNLYHPMGTNKMSPKNKGGVVDATLKVHGVDNLRIADGSVIPFTISAHPVAPITMIAEKLSDMIKDEYGKI